MGDISPNFSRWEFKCRCQQFCGGSTDTVDVELITVLEDVRQHFSRKYPTKEVSVSITSGNRCSGHNKEIGGSEGSKHIIHKASDFVVTQVHEDEVATYLEKKYPDKYGIGRYKGRTHVDVRTERVRWTSSNG